MICLIKYVLQNKTEDLNLNVFNMITEINESKTFTKDISWNVNVNLMKQNPIQVNGGIMNVDVSVKNIIYVKNIIFKCSKCSFENGKYLASIMDDSTITCD